MAGTLLRACSPERVGGREGGEVRVLPLLRKSAFPYESHRCFRSSHVHPSRAAPSLLCSYLSQHTRPDAGVS